MKSKLLLTSCAFALISILPLSAAKYYLHTGSNPWGSRSDGTVLEISAGMFHTIMNSFGVSDEVWIAAGTYTTSTDPATIALKEGMTVYGGFFGNETSISQRQLADEIGGNGIAEPWEMKYPTIINGTGSAISLADYVMFNSATNYTLDGLTIQDHYVLARYGGAINNSSTTSTMTGLKITKCTFRNINKSYSTYNGTGGGTVIYNAGNATISSCLVENNIMTATIGLNSGYAGTIFAAKAITITGCVIRNNSLNGNTSFPCPGGGIGLAGGADTSTGLIANNVIYNNTAKSGGGIFINTTTSPFNIINNTIVNNFSISTGNGSYSGGVSSIPPSAKFYNNVIFENKYATYALPTTISVRNLYAATSTTVDIQNCAYNGGALGSVPAVPDVSVSGFTGLNNNNTLATPNFVSPSTTLGYTATMPADVKAANFALQATSTDLFSKAVYIAGVTPSVDILGNSRPTDNTVDIGAYESSYLAAINNLPLTNVKVIMNQQSQLSIIAHENYMYSIFNAMGQKLTEGRTLNSITIVDVNSYVSGVYIVKVSENNKSMIAKVICK